MSQNLPFLLVLGLPVVPRTARGLPPLRCGGGRGGFLGVTESVSWRKLTCSFWPSGRASFLPETRSLMPSNIWSPLVWNIARWVNRRHRRGWNPVRHRPQVPDVGLSDRSRHHAPAWV